MEDAQAKDLNFIDESGSYKAHPTNVASIDNAAEPSMDRVRDLLFGSQIKDIDVKIQKQEERIAKLMESMNSRIQDRITSLENFLKSDTASILLKLRKEEEERIAQLQNEQRDRKSDISKMLEIIDNFVEDSNRRFLKLTNSIDSAETHLKELLVLENNKLSESIHSHYQECIKMLDESVKHMQNDFINRKQTAALITELALKLSGQNSDDVNSKAI